MIRLMWGWFLNENIKKIKNLRKKMKK